MVAMQSKNIPFEDLLALYGQLSISLSERIEILVGLGNLYSNNYQYLKAEEHYLKVLDEKDIEKVCEWMGWIKGMMFDQQ